MARMKLSILRHSVKGQQGGMTASAGVLGALLAGGMIWLAFLGGDWLAAAYTVWALGWIIGPVFSGGGDETLRPEFFSLLGLRPRRMAAGLLVAAFVGVAPAVSLLALAGLLVAGAREGVVGVLVAVPAMVLQLAVFVLLSKVTVALLGLALNSRVGAIGAGVVNGVILAFLGQVWVFMVALGQGGQIPEFVRYLPSGWGLLAVQGEYLALVAMALLIVLLLAAWAALLTRRAGRSRPSTRGRRPMRAATPYGAVVAKELRTWTRDLVRNHQLAFAFTYGVAFAAVPLLVGIPQLLPLAGPIFIMMAAAMTANAYGTDGTAHWLTLMTPGASDVRGRQLAWLAAVAPVGLLLTVVCTAVVGGPWPLVMAAVFALIGGAMGVVPLVSVVGLIPGIDPRNRGGNPLRTSEDDGSATGMAYLVLLLVALTAAPAVTVALFFGWWGVPAGLLTGVLCWWGFGLLAERRLTAQGPELLHLMRTGRRSDTGGKSSDLFKLPESMSRTQRTIVMICASLGAIPLVPQGIVAMVFMANGRLQESWFLTTYMPPGLRYPVAAGFVLLGLGMYGTALGLWLRAKKAAARQSAAAGQDAAGQDAAGQDAAGQSAAVR
uniref:Putative integral membrane transport protein n=2 Tax=Nonomuraea gerenzanensis TaxID=93944 RepID=A0A1M4E3N7_9ACTN|nr:putative integral membrane transport protein [Nonomuraea gerenzanensis]